MQHYLTFANVAEAMRSPDARLQEHVRYWNKDWKEGTTIGFSIFPRWFEINIHDAKGMSWDEVVKLLTSSSKTELSNSKTDDYGNSCWFGGTWVGSHHVRVWYNPQAF
jgi:hypothetical protein